MSTIKEYTNGEVTIVWKPDVCIHSANCVRGLPGVFNTSNRPWINAEGASTDAIVDQVKKCPSGALSYFMNDGKDSDAGSQTISEEYIAEALKDGPLMVYGNIKVKHSDGSEKKLSKATAFCRCGASENKPYCDGAHRKIGFKG